MSDRLDIDALLIGSLYGELSSTEEARLQAHLDSHPADRTALADLTRARSAFRESRFFEVQAEPPQSLSALLMQEAARRAPKKQVERESWFQRFLASLRHPAMAAAAMLVVVVGVAGTMYMRKGDQYAAPTVSTGETGTERATSSAPAPAAGSAAIAGQLAPAPESEGAKLDLSKSDNFQVRLEDPPVAKQQTADGADQGAPAKAGRALDDQAGSMEVTTPNRRPMPKDLDDAKPQPKPEQQKRSYAAPPPRGNAAPGMAPDAVRKGGEAPAADPKTVAPAPPPPPATTGAGAATRDRAPTVQQESKDAKEKGDESGNAELAWAKTQHAKIVDRVRAGNCREAANLAVQLSNRNSAYYRENVQSDRDLKQCFTAINRERELEEERAQKARAKRNDEPAPRPAEVNK